MAIGLRLGGQIVKLYKCKGYPFSSNSGKLAV